MGRIFELINRDTACALDSEKYIKQRTCFCCTRSFCRWVLAAVGDLLARKKYAKTKTLGILTSNETAIIPKVVPLKACNANGIILYVYSQVSLPESWVIWGSPIPSHLVRLCQQRLCPLKELVNYASPKETSEAAIYLRATPTQLSHSE